ncbi:hypothetical protein GM661_14925 [Iocasia frigidifontis]|uniref:Carbohydrate diacid regulator n=1 Tax=Iocasia fonsfrigidae TaxID=2682810 RepID=A0A8A7KBH8_9FIRM|nr:sugar diacid recognition domain-containing protein [Iocasia fonsfrigidae]QTL99156.1 hypothetical protein GM661_14925 [Iocasia fonsfrigidae]
MRLNPKLAKKIVNKTMNVLGKNINIMDYNGVIIASGEHKRVDSFHEISVQVIKKEKIIIIGENEAEKYKGVKPGINLPIKFNSKIIGVVGITGKIEEVEGYGRIVKDLVELMLQQELFYSELDRKNKVSENFYQQLLSNKISDIDLLKDRANLLKIKYHLLRVILVLKLEPFNAEMVTKKMQNICDKGNFYNNRNKDVFLIRGENLILIKSFSNIKEKRDIEINIQKYISEIKKNYFKETYQFIVGVGSICEKLDELYLSYQGAKHALEVGEKIHKMKDNEYIFFLNKLGYDYFLPFIPDNYANYYLHNLFNHDIAQVFSKNDIGHILEALYNNNLNLTKSADELMMHRNTLLYKLKNIKSYTGINPKEAKGLFVLLIAYHLYLYEK